MDEIELYAEIGKNIKNARKKMGITQEELANLTNYSLSFIANIESRTFQTFSISALNNIAKALNTTMKDLLPNMNTKNKIKKIKCEYCNYTMEIPKEINDLLITIENISKQKIKLTCPICTKKIIVE